MAVEVRHGPASDLTIVYDVAHNGERLKLQRKESDSRIEWFRNNWDDTLKGVLEVHSLIDHPTDPGVNHVGDGGCRWRSKTDTSVEGAVDSSYEFMWTWEEMTMKESARRHGAVNKQRKAEAKLDQYLIALTAEEEWAVEIKTALDSLGLKIDRFPSYGNGSMGTVASVVGCEEAVGRGGAMHLTRVLAVTRRAFTPTNAGEWSYYAHDGDLIKAVSRIWLRGNNEKVLSTETNRLRLSEKLGDHDPSWWKSKAAAISADRAATPGSGGRPQYLAALIVSQYNKLLRDDTRRLANPGRVVID